MTPENSNNQVVASEARQSAPSPLSKVEVVSELSACLSLVRPVSMGDDMMAEWLAVAANEVMGFAEQRPSLFRSACAAARRECSYHGQIVPKVLSLSRYDWEPASKTFKSADQIAVDQSRQISDARAQKLITQAGKALSAV